MINSIMFKSRVRFYENLQPTALICKIFGYFPLQNSFQSDGLKLKYKVLSLHTVYGPMLNITFCLLTMLYYSKVLLRLNIVTIYALRGIISVIITSYYDRYLPELIHQIEKFEISLKRFKKMNKEITDSNKSMRYLGLIGCTSYIMYSFVRLFSVKSLTVYEVYVYFATIFSRSRTFYIILYVLFCYITKQHFRHLTIIWKDTKKNILKENWNNIMRIKLLDEYDMEEVRLLHAELLKIVRNLNNCYGPRMAYALLLTVLEALLDFYVVFFTKASTSSLMIYSIFNTTTIFVITISGERLSNEV
ncbi:hypothetical protein L9F63_014767, partial [Diploptera punctata]